MGFKACFKAVFFACLEKTSNDNQLEKLEAVKAA